MSILILMAAYIQINESVNISIAYIHITDIYLRIYIPDTYRSFRRIPFDLWNPNIFGAHVLYFCYGGLSQTLHEEEIYHFLETFLVREYHHIVSSQGWRVFDFVFRLASTCPWTVSARRKDTILLCFAASRTSPNMWDAAKLCKTLRVYSFFSQFQNVLVENMCLAVGMNVFWRSIRPSVQKYNAYEQSFRQFYLISERMRKMSGRLFIHKLLRPTHLSTVILSQRSVWKSFQGSKLSFCEDGD